MKQKCFFAFLQMSCQMACRMQKSKQEIKKIRRKHAFFEDFTIHFKDGNMAVPFTRQKDKLLIRDICKNVKKWLKHP